MTLGLLCRLAQMPCPDFQGRSAGLLKPKRCGELPGWLNVGDRGTGDQGGSWAVKREEPTHVGVLSGGEDLPIRGVWSIWRWFGGHTWEPVVGAGASVAGGQRGRGPSHSAEDSTPSKQ